jgi:hypothetical protein
MTPRSEIYRLAARRGWATRRRARGIIWRPYTMTTIDELKAEIRAAVDSGQTVEDVIEQVATVLGPIGIDLYWVDHLKDPPTQYAVDEDDPCPF